MHRSLITLVLIVVAAVPVTGSAFAADRTEAPAPLVSTVDDGTQAGVEGSGAWVDSYENDGTQAGVEGTGAWVDGYENDGTQAGVEGTGAWIDSYER